MDLAAVWPTDMQSFGCMDSSAVGSMALIDGFHFGSLPSKGTWASEGPPATPLPSNASCDGALMSPITASPLSSISSSSPAWSSASSPPSSPSFSESLPDSAPRSPRKRSTAKVPAKTPIERKKTTRPAAKAAAAPWKKPKKGEAGYIPRPPNCFILFRRDFMRHQNPGFLRQDQKGRSKVTGVAWKGLSKEERARWKAMAEEAKRIHARQYPDYVYRPEQRVVEKPRRTVKYIPGLQAIYDKMGELASRKGCEEELRRLGEKAKELIEAYACNERSSGAGFSTTVFSLKPSDSPAARTDAPALRSSPLPVVDDNLTYRAGQIAQPQIQNYPGNLATSQAEGFAFITTEAQLQGPGTLDAIPLDLRSSWSCNVEAQDAWIGPNTLSLSGVYPQDGISATAASFQVDNSLGYDASPQMEYGYSLAGSSGFLDEAGYIQGGFGALPSAQTPGHVFGNEAGAIGGFGFAQTWQPMGQFGFEETSPIPLFDTSVDTSCFDEILDELDRLQLAAENGDQYGHGY
ncbi:hypothetical protein OBBRIDRAFT_791011 [Obba rivulosa]|uniref:HMG box domain-containing protein n=1 Tax=Obba rivulosa TaxID=1052685 RepID=A0A8E2AYK8_9APHY|nr:hypothetical protein OBBRIDRAFT_791011 [Obba rivulosa]